jgi:uncharacterized integral membrane protein
MAEESDHSAVATAGSTIRIVLLVAVIVILGAFVLANNQRTEIDFLVTEAEAPLIAVLAGTALLGGIIVELLRFRTRHSS